MGRAAGVEFFCGVARMNRACGGLYVTVLGPFEVFGCLVLYFVSFLYFVESIVLCAFDSGFFCVCELTRLAPAFLSLPPCRTAPRPLSFPPSVLKFPWMLARQRNVSWRIGAEQAARLGSANQAATLKKALTGEGRRYRRSVLVEASTSCRRFRGEGRGFRPLLWARRIER